MAWIHYDTRGPDEQTETYSMGGVGSGVAFGKASDNNQLHHSK